MTSPRTFDEFVNDPRYINSSQTMSAKDGVPRTLLYVEAIYDRDHWKRILNKLGFSEYFDVTPYGQISGKEGLLKLFRDNKLSEEQMIAIDADMDRLIEFEVEKFDSPFVFDTYVYSIEGIILDKDIVGRLLHQLNQMYVYLNFDFDDFMYKYGVLCYEELSRIVADLWGNNPSDLIEHFKYCDLANCDTIPQFLSGNSGSVFNVEKINHSDFLCEILQSKKIDVEGSYLYIRGHALRGTLDYLFKSLKAIIDRTETSIIVANFSGKEQMISDEISRMRFLVNNNYVLDTFLMMADLSENNIGMKHLSQKIKETVEKHLLH